jgi:hypothetical protein
MKRFATVSPAMRHRLGGLVDAYTSVICDCGTEFAARRGGIARCPACGRTDVPSVGAIVDQVGATLAASQTLDRHLQTTLSETENTMTTTHKVRGIARLVQNFHAMNEEAEKLADEMEKHAGRVSAGMTTTRAVVAQVAQAADEIEAANALFTNGGEPLDQISAGTSPASAAAGPAGHGSAGVATSAPGR